jgi:hypothetical protein
MTTPANATEATPQAAAPAVVTGTPAPAAEAPPAATPAVAAPAKPPIDTRMLVAQRKLERELKEAREETARLKKDSEQLARIKDPKQRWDAAKELGLTYEEYTNHVLGGLADDKGESKKLELPPEIQAQLDDMKAIKERDAQREAQRLEQEQSEQARNASEGARLFFEKNAEKYPLIAALGHHDSVMRAFLAKARENEGVPPDDHEFAAEQEAHIERTALAQLTKLAGTSKGKAMLASLLTTQASPASPTAPGVKGAARTLTNDLSAETTGDVDPKTITDERVLRRRAIAAMDRA